MMQKVTEQIRKVRSNRVLLGILFMMAATTLFPFMNGIVQVLSQRYASDQVIWARVTSHLIFVLILFMPQDGWKIFTTRQPISQAMRSISQLGSTSLYFSSVKFLELAQATAISFMTPFMVTLMAKPMLGEKIGFERLMALAVGFVGVLIIIRPGSDVFQWATIGVLASAACYGLYQVYTRKVAPVDPPSTSVVYSVLLGAVLLSIVMLFRWKTPETWTDAGLMFCLGIFGGVGHWCVAKAMTYAPANVISPFMYWQLIGSVIVGYGISGNLPDAYTWLGASVLVAAGLYMGWRETRPKRA